MDGILLVNKHVSFTSHQVVNQVRKIFNQKDVGHTGTLDPFADGLLIICLGKALKAIQFLDILDKTYIATIKLGVKTDTGDLTGKIIHEQEIPKLCLDKIKITLNGFLGKSFQLPPMHSALKHKGKKLYEYARKNIEVERQKRQIEVKSIKLLEYFDDKIKFEVTVSKGTYIRTLAEDIAQKLGADGHLINLTRTNISDFCLSKSVDLEKINGSHKLLSISEVLKQYPKIKVTEEQVRDVKNGKILKIDSYADRLLIVDVDDNALAVYQRVNGKYKIIRGLW